MVDGARLLVLRVRVPITYRLLVVRSSPRQSSEFYRSFGDILETVRVAPFCARSDEPLQSEVSMDFDPRWSDDPRDRDDYGRELSQGSR